MVYHPWRSMVYHKFEQGLTTAVHINSVHSHAEHSIYRVPVLLHTHKPVSPPRRAPGAAEELRERAEGPTVLPPPVRRNFLMPPPVWDASSPSLYSGVCKEEKWSVDTMPIQYRCDNHERLRKKTTICVAQILSVSIRSEGGTKERDSIPLCECTGPLRDAARPDGSKKQNASKYTQE